jgi:hypothetical protein
MFGGVEVIDGKPNWCLIRGSETLAQLRADGQRLFPHLDGQFTVEAFFQPTTALKLAWSSKGNSSEGN